MTRAPIDSTDPAALKALLFATDRDPGELAEDIRGAREAAEAGVDPAVLRDLASLELRFLAAEAARPGAAPPLRAEVGQAERAWLAFESRSLCSLEDQSVDALFELAELRAALLAKGDEGEAGAMAVEIVRRVQVVEIGEDLLQQARERYVALSTEEEDLDLGERILLLQETAAVMRALAERSGNKMLRRLSKRLWRASCDRVLAQRVERVLTPRGAAALENTSLGLLVLLFVLLFAEVLLPGGAASDWFVSIDAFICLFFISEFLFKLALSPARTSWFLRNVVTDLLPALPAAMLFLNVPNVPAGDEAVVVRALRFLRIAYFARYVQALRPILRLFRLLLFMVRGMDHLVHRFSSLLNRNFAFFDSGVSSSPPRRNEERASAFAAMRREHVLLSELSSDRRVPLVLERARRFGGRLPDCALPSKRVAVMTWQRDVPVEQVVERLHALKPEDLSLSMASSDLAALDRVSRVINAPLIRSLPFFRRLRSRSRAESPEERVTDLGRRVANWLEQWRDRILFFADFHGILTGPQILDRVATAMVNASKRPAVRLLLFGGLFLIVRAIVGEDSGIGVFLKRFVATPLLVLGGVCLFVLWLGRWLKKLAGEAAESLKRTSEAHFIGLLELQKRRGEDEDTAFLARRVFRWELKPEEAQWALCRQVRQIRRGEPWGGDAPAEPVREDINRVALLYLHFLDGAILHESDVKTSEQLLANLSLENIRSDHLEFTRRDRKRLRKLALGDGAKITGPYLWFRCITESIALETAKRVIDYNRHCLTLQRRRSSGPEVRAHMDAWIGRRRAEMSGRLLERFEPPDMGAAFVTTEFNALDFLSPDPSREDHIARIFGAEVMELLRADRRRMIREIFGTKPLDQLPRSRRIVNFYVLYVRRLSKGRIMLLPLYWLLAVGRGLGMIVAKTVEIVREILAPEKATQARVSGAAPFGIALRKIHRMKAPGLLEAMSMRTAFDPAYCGAPTSWSDGLTHDERPELEFDMDFLQMKERARESLRDQAQGVRHLVDACHFRVQKMSSFPPTPDELCRRLGERAVTVAYVTDRLGMRTLLEAEDWFERTLVEFESPDTPVARPHSSSLTGWLLRGCRRHPVSRWIDVYLGDRGISRRARRNFKAGYNLGRGDVRRTVDSWLGLSVGESPMARGTEIARDVFANHGEVSRELAALRAVQSLSVLDVRNHRRLVFQLGGYEADGESPDLAEALP